MTADEKEKEDRHGLLKSRGQRKRNVLWRSLSAGRRSLHQHQEAVHSTLKEEKTRRKNLCFAQQNQARYLGAVS